MKDNIKFSLGLIALNTLPLFSIGSEKQTVPPPNILWLVSEDNCPYIGVYGDKVARTPNIDKLGETGVVYTHSFSNAPVCAPARNTIITGMYANSSGNHQMRSLYKIPEFVKFFPEYLRTAGYYTSNCEKEDYNTSTKRSPLAWNESSNTASYKNRKPEQPFFHVQNFGSTHESSLFDSIPDEKLGFRPDDMVVFPYQPNTPNFRHDLAQYYYRIHYMDSLIGLFVEDLKQQGLYDNTIIFYYGDNGGVLPRGKRYLFESGTRVPMIVHVPEMYKHLMPDRIGAHSDRIVSFVDLAPTILNLVGIKIPEYMQGQPFLGENVPQSKEYAFMFRGRMDEKTDLMHAARNKQYRYIRNYYPERIYAQYLDYLWRSRAVREWERMYYEGKLNDVQAAYWKTKPYEELYDIVKDPHNVNNLANNPDYSGILKEMSDATDKWIAETQPIDVLPEPMMFEIDKKYSLTDSIKGKNFPLMKLHEIARMSAKADKNDFKTLYAYTKDKNPAIAFWGIKAMFQYKEELKSAGLLDDFKKNLSHPELYIQNLTANVLVSFGEKMDFRQIILKGVNSENGLNRSEALQLYMKLDRDKEFDKRIKERYETEKVNGPGSERNVYSKLYDIKVALERDKR